MASSAATDPTTPFGAPAPGATPPPLRASDADRAATVRMLQDAVARGLLTPDEGSQRMAAAFAAVHRDDLGALTADLPAAPSSGTAPGWRPLATMAAEQLRASLSGGDRSRLQPARVALAVLLAALLLVVVGSVVAELLFDGPGGGRGPGGPGRG
jgi:hypothetical protein